METVSFREVVLEGGWLKIKIPQEYLRSVMGFIRGKKDKFYDLIIKEHRKKRSLDANAYCWVLIGKIADALRITPNEVYLEAIRGIGGNYEIIPIKAEATEKFRKAWSAQGIGWPCDDLGPCRDLNGYHYLRAFYGSSTFDTRQMSILIDNLIQDCEALGVETWPPEKLALLKEEWC
jgi:hypothetical protein